MAVKAKYRDRGLLTSDQPDFKEKVAERRRARRQATRIRNVKQAKIKPTIIVGEFTSLVMSICPVCSKPTLSKTYRKYCHQHSDNYTRGIRSRFNFKFKVTDYPDLFDLKLIEEHGWYSPGGRSTLPINYNGVSRDHKVSVFSAIQHDYDIFYITHPLNCELMLHSDNKSKHTADSISYDDLKSMVDDYESKKKTSQ